MVCELYTNKAVRKRKKGKKKGERGKGGGKREGREERNHHSISMYGPSLDADLSKV